MREVGATNLDSFDVVAMKIEVRNIASIEGSHQRMADIRMRKTQRMAELMSCHLEKISTYTKNKC